MRAERKNRLKVNRKSDEFNMSALQNKELRQKIIRSHPTQKTAIKTTALGHQLITHFAHICCFRGGARKEETKGEETSGVGDEEDQCVCQETALKSDQS